MKSRQARGMIRPPPIQYTKIEVHGRNGAGEVYLAGATVFGPFAPDKGDQVVSIRSVYFDDHRFDNKTGFASEVGPGATLQQFDTANLSTDVFEITFARTR